MIPDREARPYDVINPLIPRVARRIRKSRLSICKSCEHFTTFETCGMCGCFMPAKTALPNASCPAGKWDRYLDVEVHEQANANPNDTSP